MIKLRPIIATLGPAAVGMARLGLAWGLASLALTLPVMAAPPSKANWNAQVALVPGGGHLRGNPASKVKLIVWLSYTCSRCARFAKESDVELQLGFIALGKVSLEVRHALHDPVDLAVAMLTNCGPPEKFFMNHQLFLQSQARWIAPLAKASPAQRARWTGTDLPASNRAIAADFHFYELMEGRGYDRVAVNRCLADKALAERLTSQAKVGFAAGLRAAPGFMINGIVLNNVQDWAALRPKLAEGMK